MTKDELIAKLRQNGNDVVSKIREVPGNAWDEGRYENGWNARQILAHVASIEWTYPRLIELAKQPAAQAAPSSAPSSATGGSGESPQVPPGVTASRPMTGGVNSYNDRQVEKRSGASIDELIAEFEKNRAATIAAFESADDALLSKQIQSAGGIKGTLADVVNGIAIEHVRGHIADMAGGRSGV